jgi:alpha-N-arabinofuranosidase
MYRAHMGAEAVRAVFSAPSVGYDRNGQPARLWGLNGSASRKDKTVTLTVVNPSPDTPREAEISVAGARLASCAVRTLTAPTLDAHNSFAQPDAIPSPTSAIQQVPAGGLVLTFPRASVTAVTLTLG